MQQDFEIANGAGHHSVIKTPGKDDYYMVYHRRPGGVTRRDSRMTCIENMEFDENGYIRPVVITDEGVKPNPINK